MTATDFWKGEQGDRYTDRNKPRVAARYNLWKAVTSCMPKPPSSALEVGANVGQNLIALAALLDDIDLYAVEPNKKAAGQLASSGLMPPDHVNVAMADRLPFGSNTIEMVFTSGVLIHIPPEDLLLAMQEMYRVSRRYIVCIEYFADQPETKLYHGETDRLWKRDFGSYWMDNFKLHCLGYGFAWKRITGLDNLTWWAFEKA